MPMRTINSKVVSNGTRMAYLQIKADPRDEFPSIISLPRCSLLLRFYLNIFVFIAAAFAAVLWTGIYFLYTYM